MGHMSHSTRDGRQPAARKPCKSVAFRTCHRKKACCKAANLWQIKLGNVPFQPEGRAQWGAGQAQLLRQPLRLIKQVAR